jgi:anti-sigma regulatory factor (Ser/Thr protein kinase)
MPGDSGQLAAGPTGHVVTFYDADEELAASVGSYLGEGLSAGGSAVMLATHPHCLAFKAELAAAGIDVSGVVASGQLLVLDAAQTLQGFWTDDHLDRDGFETMAHGCIGTAADAGQPIRIYAEMVALLWDAGHVAAAMELEVLWNDQATRRQFALLCAYPASLVTAEAHGGALEEVCGLHTAVIAPYPAVPDQPPAPSQGAAAVRSFPDALESTRAARHFVLETLGSHEDHALAVDAAIITGELAANAVLHARSGFTVAVSRSAAAVRISVRDATPLQPGAARAALEVSHGHGLWVVAQLADNWAVQRLPHGKVVWAELPASPRA